MTAAPPAEDFDVIIAPLWALAQSGDQVAYRECLTRIAGRLRAYLRRRMQTLPDEVEDLVQETLLAIHLQRGTHDPQVPLSHWLLAIARYKLIDLWRRRGRREVLHDPLDALAEEALPTVSAEPLARRDLDTLLAGLPLAQRQAILLTRIEGLSVAEAAAQGGVSVAALKVQVHRGLKRLAVLARRSE